MMEKIFGRKKVPTPPQALRVAAGAWQRGGWTPKDLVRQILAMKTSSGGRQDGKEFALDQLEGWLEMSQITYTPESLAFLVHQAGANIKQVQAGKKLQVTRFIYGLERVVTTPVVF